MSMQELAPGILPYGPPIALAVAKRVAEAAEAEARRNGWPMVIAVVDSTGHLVVLHRGDQAQHGSVAIAQDKAQTAVDFKRPTKALEDAVREGGIHLRLLATRGATPLEGGVPLIQDGRLIGAVGVSGMRSDQDGQVAAAGAAAIG